MQVTEYLAQDGVGLGRLVKKGDVTATELAEIAIGLIEKHNPALNGVVQKGYDMARKAAADGLPDGPFSGVPFLLKDINALCVGLSTRQGSRLFEHATDDHDSELTIRYKRAGLNILGKTNAPEFGILPTTESLFYGPARNPWNTGHSTGGSSGGSAAMVAAGCLPFAHANDGGGSIRIPAAACGLVGLKPTRARNPLGPDLGDALGGLVCDHVVSRTVRDTAYALDATSGPDIGDPYWAPAPKRPFIEALEGVKRKLTVAVATTDFLGNPLHPECVAAVEKTAKTLESMGHIIVEGAPSAPAEMVTHAFMTLWTAGMAALAQGAPMMGGGIAGPDTLEPMTWALVQKAGQTTAAEYVMAQVMLQRISRFIAQFFETVDVMLTTTLTRPPVPLGYFDVTSPDFEGTLQKAGDYVNTPVFNFTGQPAISLPLHQSADGLPVGVQIIGRFGDEDTLIAIAADLEQALPWAGRHPPIWG
ncbi:amidase [Zavarzinia sp.]|uniref:amidase n=1 Tax=Zavarzinia sp. TaxID=2027920 RepID=UPI0035636CF2